MRKFYLFIVALCAMALSAQAGVKVLYNQNYQTVTDGASSGWVGQVSGGLAMGSTDDGTKYVQYSTGANNDRSAHLIWGEDLLKSQNVTSYSVSFYFSIVAFGSNHTTSEIAVMSDETTCTTGPNSNFRYPYITSAKANQVNKNWLFDLTQLAQYDAENQQTGISQTGDQPFVVNGDSTNEVKLSSGMFYCVNLDVDVERRTVDYSVTTVDGTTITSGVYNVPEDANMYATGLYYLGGRYQNVARFTLIQITTESEGDFANKPSISLTKIENGNREYTIGFMEGEALHLKYQGGEEQVISYDDSEDGNYVWANNGTAGSLVAWTTIGDATSEENSIEVENTNVTLPAATADIANVEVGYGKTYKLQASNADVPLQPQLFLDYTFTDKDGNILKDKDGNEIQGKGKSPGQEVSVPCQGFLHITTKAAGYESTSTVIENNVEYEVKHDFNFAHLGESEIVNAGFSADGNVTGNYATYGRLYWYSAEDSTKMVYNEIPQYTKKTSEWTDGKVLDGITFTATPVVNVHIYQGVGMTLEGIKGDNMDTGKWINTLYLTVDDATENDIVAISSYSNYGSNALHPAVADQAAFLASDNAPVTAIQKGNANIGLYRISDCLARVLVYCVKGSTGIKDVNAAEKVAKEDVYYTISGIKLPARPTQKGIYIKNGKTVVIK